MKKGNNNIRIMVENRKNADGFDIYIYFSGKREYLMSRRHNGLLYMVLKNGMYLGEMRRWRPKEAVKYVNFRSKTNGLAKLESMMKHLLIVIDEYLLEREAC